MSSDLVERAEGLHLLMLESDLDAVFDQKELQELSDITSIPELMATIQELINRNLVKPVRQGDVLKFQAVKISDAEKLSKMSKDESMIYSYIEASGREGIWTKTIKAKTNLHQHVVLRCLKSLESQSFIKAIKSVKYPTRKIYMLYNLTPSIEVTGGPWFTDSELDTEFIESLLLVVWRFVASKSYPNAFNKRRELIGLEKSIPQQQSFPPTFQDYPSIDDIMHFIETSGIANVEVSSGDIRSLCNVLVYDQKIEVVNLGSDTYKATWQSILENGGGLIEGEDIYAVQNSVPFSLFDNYRIIEETAVLEQEGEEIATPKEKQKYYLDAFINL